MLFDYLTRRIVGVTALGAAVLGLSAVATLAATHPAAAQAALKSIESTVTCTTSTACVIGNNTSNGPGVSGQGYSSYGVEGSSAGAAGVKGTGNTNYGVEGVSNKNYGVWGNTATGKAGVAGTTSSSTADAIYGYTSGSGNGVEGSSYDGYALSGTSTYSVGVFGKTTSGAFGVYGTTASGSGTGVTGYVSSSGVGVAGTTSSGTGVEGDADGGAALSGYSGSGNGAYTYSTSGYGLSAETYGQRAILAINHNGDGSEVSGTYIGMIGRAPASGGFPLVLTDSSANNLFYVDGAGDVYYTGSLNNFARTSGGGTVNSYTPRTAVPTVEDYGTAQLVAGAAAVRLEPTFASSIDMSAGYRVFITPNGDTRGLFVPTKTAAGFIVRETQGGRSTLSFDYRIVATPLGQSGKRMALVSTANMPHAPILNVVAPKRQRPAALKARP